MAGPEQRQRTHPSSAFSFCSGLNRLADARPPGRATFFTQSTLSNVNLFQTHPRRQTAPAIWAPLIPERVTREMNQHTDRPLVTKLLKR